MSVALYAYKSLKKKYVPGTKRTKPAPQKRKPPKGSQSLIFLKNPRQNKKIPIIMKANVKITAL